VPVVTVVVPVHGAGETLGRQLRSLTTQSDAPSHDVVVVLNRATASARAVARSFLGALPLTIVDADRVAAAGYARNAGARSSRSEVILFCDADDVVAPHWLARLSAPLRDGRTAFVGGAPVVDRSGLAPWAYRRYYAAVDGPQLAFMAPGTWFPISASLGVRREAFDDVGGFDEGFPAAGFEEVDLARRLFRRGCRVGLAPDAQFVYSPRRGFGGLVAQRRAYARGLAYLTAKEGRPLYRPGRTERVVHLLRVAGGALLHRRVTRPGEFTLSVLEQWFRYEANWEFGSTDQIAPVDTEEFVVPQGVPVIEGLAFEGPIGPGGIEGWYAPESVETRSIQVLDVLAAPGDVVVDCDVGVGAFATGAAFVTAPTGRVHAAGDDATSRRLTASNTLRHHVADRVTLADRALSDVLGDDDTVGVVKLRADQVHGANYLSLDALLARGREFVVVIEVVPGALDRYGTRLRDLVDAAPTEQWKTRLAGTSCAQGAELGRVPSSWSGVVVLVPRSRWRVLGDLDLAFS